LVGTFQDSEEAGRLKMAAPSTTRGALLIAETRGTDLHDVLRERLVFMRSDLIERLAKGGIDGGMLALLGSVGAAIAAIDAIPAKEESR
jgi:hypothetical protein